MTVKDIARVCHEANREYCATLGDYSQLAWDKAPSWQRESALNGVQFALDNPNSTPEDSHNNWLAVKTAEGWVYAPVKDVAKKQHPCFVPYAELPEAQKAKDHLFQAIVKALSVASANIPNRAPEAAA